MDTTQKTVESCRGYSSQAGGRDGAAIVWSHLHEHVMDLSCIALLVALLVPLDTCNDALG
eukprot:559882-Amphidinium_carterae.2